MENFVSNWCTEKKIPQTYVLPAAQRPGDVSSAPAIRTPVIDLSKAAASPDRVKLVEEIMQASKSSGLFQVINHGISNTLLHDAMEVFREFFQLPSEDKSYLYSEEMNEKCVFYTSSFNFANEKTHYWRDILRHDCTCVKECVKYWPLKPSRYRDVVAEYVVEVKDLGSRILQLICEGLGLAADHFANKLTADAFMTVNHYPPCPDPKLTLGLPSHCDPSVLTVLMQGDVAGLQVCVDGKWLMVEPHPDALVINLGFLMQFVSNGVLKAALHRVVTNSDQPRTTSALFIRPTPDCLVEPAVVSSYQAAIYKPFQFKDFVETYARKGGTKEVFTHYSV